MSQKPLVLLVDDDELPMEFYVKALQSKEFEAKLCFNADTALDFSRRENKRIKLIILDVMMPPGYIYRRENTWEGLTTGIYLYKDLKILCPKAKFIILTNVTNQETLLYFTEHGLPVFPKRKYPPFELAKLVENIISECNRKSPGEER